MTDTDVGPATVGYTGFVLEIPAHANYATDARIFAAAVARDLGLDHERIEDLKLAVSEAFANVVHGGLVGCAVLELFPETGRLRVRVTGIDPGLSHPLRETADDLDRGLDLLEALVGPLEVSDDGDGTPTLGFCVSLDR